MGNGGLKIVTKPESNNIEELIQNEMRALAGEYFEDVWNEVLAEDLDIQLVAEVFIERVLKKIAKERGEDCASKLVSHFHKMDEMGFLPEARVLQ